MKQTTTKNSTNQTTYFQKEYRDTNSIYAYKLRIVSFNEIIYQDNKKKKPLT